MTITLRPWMTILLVALIGALGGLAIGQITQAHSAKATASSATTRSLRGIKSDLDNINESVGSTFLKGTVIDELDDIKTNTGQTCRAVGGTSCRTLRVK